MADFDTLYYTSSKTEYNYLREHGIYYSSTKIDTDSDFDSIVYIYKKSPTLFATLSILYDQINNEHEYSFLKAYFDDPEAKVETYSSIDDAMKAVAAMMRERTVMLE